MNYIVKARELQWAGKNLQKGQPINAVNDRDFKRLELLEKIGKIEKAPERKPVRQVATTKAPEPKPEPKLETASKAEVSALTTDDAPTTGGRFYATRRLKAED